MVSPKALKNDAVTSRWHENIQNDARRNQDGGRNWLLYSTRWMGTTTTSTQEGEQHCGQKYSVHYELRTALLYRLVGIPGNREKASSLHFDSFHHSTNQLSTISPRIRFPPISEDTLTRMHRRFLTFTDETTYLSFPPFNTNIIQVSICAYSIEQKGGL